jgi:hypothetical protein
MAPALRQSHRRVVAEARRILAAARQTLARRLASRWHRALLRCSVCCWPFDPDDTGYALEYVPAGTAAAAAPVLIHQRCLATWLVVRLG